jgi:hypothetical protein
MSFLSVNEDLYNVVLKNFNYKNFMKLTEKKDLYLRNIYVLYIIESIIEDVEIINSKENINIKDNKDGLKDEVTYAIIYSQKLKPFDDENNINKKNQFFIDFIKNNYSDLVNYTLFLLKKLNEDKEGSNNNNITIHSCIKCLDIINNIYTGYHNINSKTDKGNLINIKYKALKNIIENNNLSKNITEASIYEEIIIHIIKYIYYILFDNKNKGESNEIISTLNQKFYILLFSLLYTNKEIFNIINKKEKNKYFFENVLKNLYLNERNKMDFGIVFASIFKQIGDKISDEFLSYLIDLLFIVLQKYIKSDKKRIENGFISIHLKYLLNYCCKKEI